VIERESSSSGRDWDVFWLWTRGNKFHLMRGEESRYLFILPCLRGYLDVATRRLSCMSVRLRCLTQRLWKHCDLSIL
jgi:hypothetical protein